MLQNLQVQLYLPLMSTHNTRIFALKPPLHTCASGLLSNVVQHKLYVVKKIQIKTRSNLTKWTEQLLADGYGNGKCMSALQGNKLISTI